MKTKFFFRYYQLLFFLCLCSQPILVFAQAGNRAFFFTSFDGTKIHYEVNGKGLPVILIHGFMGTGDSWKNTPLYKDLLHEDYQVVLIDLRGNGLSDKPHNDAGYENDAEAKDVMVLAKNLGLKKYDVIGYSRGSIIAARLLVLDKRVACAVLGGMGDGFTDAHWPRRIMFYHALNGDSVPELKSMVEYVKKSGMDQQSLAYQQKWQPSASPAELQKIKQPVLVISGNDDPDDGSPAALSAMMPSSALVLVQGNHGSVFRSQALADKVILFIKKQTL